MQRNSDELLVKSCLAGDRKAFEQLVERYEKKLFNVAYRVISNTEDAMDATQSTFVKAYEKLDTFNPEYKFFSWIYRILLNESLTLVNKRKRFEKWDSDVVGRTKAMTKGPEERYKDTEIDRHLQVAMMNLKPEYRVVIVLKHFHDFSYKEMSDILGVPEKTVKSRLFTARRMLKDILSKRGLVR